MENQQTGLDNYDKVIQQLKENRDRAINGESNSLMYPVEELNKLVPGITPKRYDIITAGTKVGKSRFVYYFYIIHHIIKELNGIVDIPYYGIIFSLEIAESEFIKELQAAALFHIYGIEVDAKDLNSYDKENPLPQDILDKLELLKETFFKLFYKRFKIFDNIKNPTGIYKETRKWLSQYGDFIAKNGSIVPDPSKGAYSYFKPYEYGVYMGIIDHYSLLHTESGMDKRQTILKMSEYCVTMRNNWQMNPVAIQQQENAGQKKSFTYAGDVIVDQLIPSGNALADCKDTQKDCDLLIGLFNPSKYRLETFEIGDGKTIDISVMKDTYRCLLIDLDRKFGSAPAAIHLKFKGAASAFKSLF